MIFLALPQKVEFGGEFHKHLLAMQALTLGVLGIEAERVAATAFTLADHHPSVSDKLPPK
jgi:hypothetical protein